MSEVLDNSPNFRQKEGPQLSLQPFWYMAPEVRLELTTP